MDIGVQHTYETYKYCSFISLGNVIYEMKLLIPILLLNIVNIGFVHSQISPVEIQIILDTINGVRRNATPTAANAREVRWSNCLAGVTYDFQSKCLSVGMFNSNRTNEAIANGCSVNGNVGETAYIVSNGMTTFSDVILAWANEASSYDYDTNACSSICRNYLQIVTADLEFVGCSLYERSNCGETGVKVLCDFSTSSMLGQLPYISGEACSGCAGEYSQCDNGLCAFSDPPETTTPPTTNSPTVNSTTSTTVGTTSNATKCSFIGFLLIASLLAILLASMS